MRSLSSRVATTIVVGLLFTGCASAAPPTGSATPASSASAVPSTPPASAATATPSPGTVPVATAVAAPSLPPLPASASLPVRISDMWVNDRVQMTPGPAGDLYVSISSERSSVVARLDPTGKPRAGWPIALGDTWCSLPGMAADGSLRVVCSFFSDGIGRAHAFSPDGRPMAGWPVELPGSIAAAPRVVAGELVVPTYVVDDGLQVITGLRLVAVSADGTVRTGTSVETPNTSEQDWRTQLGPDGTGYVLAFPNSATGETEITAFDLAGVRQGWLARVHGWSSSLAFGPDGHIYATQGAPEKKSSSMLAFDRDGRSLPIGSDPLPVTATSVFGGAAPRGGPIAPPVVAQDGTTFIISEEDGTTIYRLSAAGDVMSGWPYNDTIGLEWSFSPPGGDTGGTSWRLESAVGPGNLLYLLHPARTSNLGGSITAIGPDGRVRPGWPVTLERSGSMFASVMVASDGTAYAVVVEPEGGDRHSATILAIAPDSTVRYGITVVEP